RTRVGKHARRVAGHTAGSVSERLDDLHNMFGDPEVRAIITAIGGYNSNQLLEDLDYELIKANPKIFLCYSDITALHFAIWQKTGLGVVLGPAILPQFGEHGGLHPYTWSSFQRTLMVPHTVGDLVSPSEAAYEYLEWDDEDIRAREHVFHKGPQVVRE